MRTSIVVLSVLFTACKPSTGKEEPPQPSLAGDMVASIEEGSVAHSMFQMANTTGCSAASSRGKVNVSISCSASSAQAEVIMTGVWAGSDDVIITLLNNQGGRAVASYPVTVTLPPNPAGGFVNVPAEGEMGRSVTLNLDVSNEVTCAITLTPNGIGAGATVSPAVIEGQCPSEVRLNMGSVISQGFTQKVCVEARGKSSKNIVLEHCINVLQVPGVQKVDSPQVIEVVNGVAANIILRSNTCSFLKANPGVHRGTERSYSGRFDEGMVVTFLSNCEVGFSFGSGRVDPGPRDMYFAARKSDGTLTTPYRMTVIVRD